MATGLSIGKIGNIFRNKVSLMYEITEIYRPSITRKKAKLIELVKEKAEIATKSELAKKIKVLKGFYTAEMAPASKSEMERLRADIALAQEFIKTGCLNHLTVKQAWLLFLVCTEIILWFFLGETIGKGHIVGYSV